MKKLFRQYLFIFLLLLAAILLGYNYFYRPFQVVPEEITTENQSESTFEEASKPDFDTIVSELSSEQKIMQMVAQPITVGSEEADESITATDAAKLTESPGSFTLFGNEISFTEASQTIAELESVHTQKSIKPLFLVDHEGGKVQRLSGEGFSRLPSWRTICALDVDERRALLLQSANELQSVGIDVVLAPVLDVGENKVLTDRICSASSYPIVADRVMDYVTIFEEFGILSVIKHFPGIGETTRDLHTSFDVVEVLENDVRLYRYVIDQVPQIGVMISHVGVASQDRELPCSMSPYCVGELQSVYPDVLIVTDALEMDAALYNKQNPRVPKTLAEASRDAIWAGNDVLLYGEGVTESELASVVSQLTKEYNVNEEFRTLVDNSVKKIIEYKYALE